MADLVRIGRALRSIASFVRLSALGGTLILPVLGAAAVRTVSFSDVGAALAVAAAFHVFAYVANDVVDLPLDRGEPRRASSPLVRGVIGRGLALAIVVAQVPLAFALARGAGTPAGLSLAGAFVLLGIYDVAGKRCSFPPSMDLLQGLGWAGLVGYGALGVGAATPAVVVTAVFVVEFIVLANGVHGPLRDLEHDTAFGASTTAIRFGARQVGRHVVIPSRLRRYALALHVLLAVTVMAPTAIGVASEGPAQRVATVGGVAVLVAAGSAFLLAADRAEDVDELRLAGMMHLLTMLPLPLAMLWFRFDPSLRVVVTSVYVLPLLAHGWLPAALQWTVRAIGGALPARGIR